MTSIAASRTTISSVSEDAAKISTSAAAATEESSGKTAVSSALSLDTAITATSSVYLNKVGIITLISYELIMTEVTIIK